VEIAGEVVSEQRGDEVKPVVVMEGFEGGWSGLSTVSSTRTTQWPLRLVA
jgi:hypothetical protein